ncbi:MULTISPECIES: UDP-N-acetylmuramate--L-alanine ligase [Flammeovirga]|uniref:Peptidoglycan synthetase n=1 Tax=Flammeovirga agarivorans TaxID=2726742 RepID=A0A7X8XWQ3_9BACT|nr:MULTISPECIES: Mur ligase family protein [Flammeovirga]NLR92449.1 peptidoglycan synthetase [Flammeovirga agarivorans]
MRVHFIAIGGSIMHNLAISLKQKGYNVSGSDDGIYEPALSNLKEFDLLPEEMGWNPDIITKDINAVILGMHAKKDNPELVKAKQLGLNIYSFPEYVYSQTKNKQRIVVAGSHGKTTVSSMIIHVLKYWNIDCDYLVGASLKGVDRPVKITEKAPVIILEGDEYLSSPLDPQPKFLHYHQHIGIITGIAWDHINVYPTYEGYEQQFEEFIKNSPKGGALIYSSDDKPLKKLVKRTPVSGDVDVIPYDKIKSKVKDGKTIITAGSVNTETIVFGDHNLQNMSAAMEVCKRLNVSRDEFIEAIATFEGAALRMQLLKDSGTTKIFRDFAHAPSKVKATVHALAKQYKEKVVACLELHTFSSLTDSFLSEYSKTLKEADIPLVYFNPKVVENKGLKTITKEDVYKAFDQKNVEVFTNEKELEERLLSIDWSKRNLLLMSSGRFNQLPLDELVEKIG